MQQFEIHQKCWPCKVLFDWSSSSPRVNIIPTPLVTRLMLHAAPIIWAFNCGLWAQFSFIQHNGVVGKVVNGDRGRRRNVIIGDRVEKKKARECLGIYAVPLRSCPKKHVLTVDLGQGRS